MPRPVDSFHRGCVILPGTPSQPVAFLQIATQYENAGDCLINRELIRLLASRSTLFLNLATCPPDFARQVLAGIPESEQWRRSSWPFYLRMLWARLQRRRCYWFLTPGGITGNGPRDMLPAWLRDLPLPFAAALGVRVCQVGASFGAMTAAHLARWRQRRRWLYRLCPRDSTSARYLAVHGIRHDGCIPDLAFELFISGPPPSVQADGDATRACFSFRTDQYPQQADDLAAAAVCLHRRLAGRAQWRAIVQVGRDRPGMERLCARLAQAGCAIASVADHHTDLDACMAFYQEVSLVVSNRLHVLLMAARQGARILAVVDGPGGAKLQGVLRDIGLEGAAVRSQDIIQLNDRQLNGLTVDGRALRVDLQRAFDALVR